MEVDSPNGTQGTEPVSFVAKSSGSYHLEVRSLEKEAAAGRYAVNIAVLREATLRDKAGDIATALIAAKTDDERAAMLAKENDLMMKELPKVLILQGRRHSELSDYPKALAVFKLAQSIAEKIDDKIAIFLILHETGNIYRLLGNFATAQELFQKQLTIAEANGDKHMIVRALLNLGNAHYFQGHLTQALELFRRGLTIAEPLGIKQNVSLLLNSIGNVYKDQGSYPQALEYYKKSLVLSEELKDTPKHCGNAQ